MKPGTKLGLAVLFSAFWLHSATAQTTPPLPMPKAPDGVTVDGVLTEWNDSSFVYSKDTKLKYIISSDGTYLYLIAKLDEKPVRQKALGGGITISFNTEGKKKKSYSVSYPVPADDGLDYVAKTKARVSNAKTDGFKGVPDALTFPEDHGFKGHFAFSDDIGMGYELAIPLKALNIKPGTTTLNINIAVNALDKPTGGGGDTPPNSGGGGGRGGRGGGGGGRGGRGGGGGGSGANAAAEKDDTPLDMYNTNDFWLTYTLPVIK